MSTEGGISTWMVARLKAQVAAFTSVAAIGGPDEFEIIGRNVPAAGVLIMAGLATDQLLMNGTQVITIDVEVYSSSRTFIGGEDLTATNGSYDLFDSVWTALVGQTPTGTTEQLRYLSHDRQILDNGLVLMVQRFRTMAIK
jgi:hypothetical protein